MKINIKYQMLNLDVCLPIRKIKFVVVSGQAEMIVDHLRIEKGQGCW